MVWVPSLVKKTNKQTTKNNMVVLWSTLLGDSVVTGVMKDSVGQAPGPCYWHLSDDSVLGQGLVTTGLRFVASPLPGCD